MKTIFPRGMKSVNAGLLAAVLLIDGPHLSFGSEVITDIGKGLTSFYDAGSIILEMNGLQGAVGVSSFCGAGLASFTGEFEEGVGYGGTVTKTGGTVPFGRITVSSGGPNLITTIQGQEVGYFDTGCTLSTMSYAFSVENRYKSNFFDWPSCQATGGSSGGGSSGAGSSTDGPPQVTPSFNYPDPGSLNWSITSSALDATINSSSGTVSGGKTPGTIRVKVSKTGLVFEKLLDVGGSESGCNSGACPTGDMSQTHPTLKDGVDVRIDLGWHRRRDTAGFLHIQAVTPGPLLATPATVQYNFIRPGVEKIIANNVLRQVKALDGLADVVTNNANKYHIDFYRLTNVTTRSGFTGAYPVTGSPFATVTVENPGSDTNKLRVTQTRDGADTVWDYAWLTNGWSLTNGGGLRVDTTTIAWSETNTLRTETHQILSASGSLVFQRIQKFRTNAMMGERLIEEVTGTGVNALTNSWSWTTNGWLEQVVRSDGSWELYQYDSLYRPTNVYSSYRNQGVTTDGSLCRRLSHDYTTNVIPASGDGGFYNGTTPRRTIEYLLGQEVGRKYFVATNGARIEYQCVHPGVAWDNSSNLVTVTRLFTNGYFIHQPRSVLRPDGTIDVFEYNPVKSGYTNYNITNIVMHGHPSDAYGTNIDEGTKTTSILDHTGKLLSRTVVDVPSAITLASETYSYDGFKRLTNTVYLDGTSTSTAYDCCSISSTTERDGTVTTYTSDSLKRALTITRNSIIVSNVYDAAGNVLSTIRIGTNGNAITTGSATFDDAGRQMSATDGVGNVTSLTNYVNSGGQTVKTTTYANGSTRIETFNRDGSLTNLTGTAVHGLRYDYGVESESGTQRAFTKEIKLNTDGSDSSEWVKTYTDLVGNSYKTVFPDSAASQTFYNSSGQAAKQVDPDGVTTLLQYDDMGELEYTAIDINTNGTIDFAGTDRITLTTNVVVNNGVKDVRRTVTYVWGTTNLDSSTLVSVVEASVDGLRTWNASFGLTNQTRIVFAGSGTRYVTNTAPDDTTTVQTFANGRLTQLETRNSTLGTLRATTYAFDAHGRTSLITDARTGTTTNTFDDADRIISTSTPAPGDGSGAQVTSMTYNNMGWVTTNTLPDGGLVKTVFHLTGEQATNSGAHTYPVAYTYDHAGRLQTMTTWTNFASVAGAAVTEWKYDGQRGWLTNKVYADGKGPVYTYTAAGRLATRAWARGVSCTYGYNTAGELSTLDYSDSTADVAITFDRRGRTIQTVAEATSSLIFDNAGNLLSESFTTGALSGITLTNQFDSLLRRTNVAIFNSQSSILNSGYAYDSASRLSSVTFGTNSAVYAYLTNSSLVDNLAFKNGATTRMTTSNTFDNLNRLTSKSSQPSASGLAPIAFSYAYNTANQRTAITNADSSRWAYAYDTLGQVTSGKRYWSDGNVVAGQQFEYSFDDIGNRLTAAGGGDEWGANLRSQSYSANNLNQYTQRTIPPYVDVQGSAHSNATVTVNLQSTYRKAEYFRAELSVDNSSGPLRFGVTNVAVLTNGGGPDIVTTNEGNLLVAKATEAFLHDLDGNLTSDSLWTNTWNGENRLIATESKIDVPSAGRAKETWTHLLDGRWIERIVANWNGSAYTNAYTNRFVWDGKVLLAIIDHTNGLVSSFARGVDMSGSVKGAGGIGGILAANIATNGIHFVAFDGNGNLSALVSATSGDVTANYEYSPFGETLRADGVVAKANPIRFSTQLADDVPGYKKYLHRDLTDTGRWLSKDPALENGGMNLYGFVNNDPINNSDLLGLNVLQLPPGKEGPPGYRQCGQKVYADGRSVVLWCPRNPPKEPSSVPPWMSKCEPPPKDDCPPIFDAWPSNPLDVFNRSAARRVSCSDKFTGCTQTCIDRYFKGKCSKYYEPCTALCWRQKLKCEIEGGSTGGEPTPDAPKISRPEIPWWKRLTGSFSR